LGREPWAVVKNRCPSNESSSVQAWAAAAHQLYTETSCPYILFTDAITSVAFHIVPNETPWGPRVAAECYCPAAEDSPVSPIAGLLLQVCIVAKIQRPLDYTPIRPYTNERGPFPIGPVPPTTWEHTSLSDWTPDEMQSRRGDFLDWARKLARHGKKHELEPDTVMKGTRYTFPELPEHLRCPVEPIEPPTDTMDRVRLHMRQNSPLLHEIFKTEFFLRISGTISVGSPRWSQVVRAEIQPTESTNSDTNLPLPEVCVKLYDERFFDWETHLAARDDDDSDCDNDEELPNFATAAEAARQEDVAYQRMRRFQGSFFPHYYGLFVARLVFLFLASLFDLCLV
jgi:hypothetical protein